MNLTIRELMEEKKEARAEGYAQAIEDAAKAAINTPVNPLRSQTEIGLRLSIADTIRALLSKGTTK